jgi:hypothetical protein
MLSNEAEDSHSSCDKEQNHSDGCYLQEASDMPELQTQLSFKILYS